MYKRCEDFDLISQMVDETLNGLSSDSSSKDITCAANEVEVNFSQVVQLEFEFDYFLGAYDANRKCYIFQIQDQVVECPENWGPFKLAACPTDVYENLFQLKKHEDIDHFFDIMEATSGLSANSINSVTCISFGSHLKLILDIDQLNQAVKSDQSDHEEMTADVVQLNFGHKPLKAA